MGDYHFVYKDVEGASTQWDDIQRKLGNLPPKPPAFKPPPFTPAEDQDSKPKDKAWIDGKTEEELEDLEDDDNLDDDRFLQEYRCFPALSNNPFAFRETSEKENTIEDLEFHCILAFIIYSSRSY